jgi:hypothetical protein
MIRKWDDDIEQKLRAIAVMIVMMMTIRMMNFDELTSLNFIKLIVKQKNQGTQR